MDKINYSIIIPHYNIPDLLMRCLKSIPVRSDVQVIVVDDCSPGANEYKQRYPELSRPFVEFYSTLHGGSAGNARNVGLKHAKGNWVIFSDSDDFFTDDFSDILDEYVDNDSDIVIFNSKGVLSNDINIEYDRDMRTEYFENYEKDADDLYFRFCCVTPWAKIIKRNFVERIGARFDETRYSNDYFFSVFTGFHAKKLLPVNRIMYVVTRRDGSLSSLCLFDSKKLSLQEAKDRFLVCMKVKDFLCKNNVPLHLESYKSYAMFYLHSYRWHFIFSYMMIILKYPSLCANILKYWLSIKLKNK